MEESSRFFLPTSSPETAEDDFARLAQFAGRPLPEFSQRIFSITYRHNSEEWTATVGEKLYGRGKHAPRLDPATVLAIFPGTPYLVVTDCGFVRDVRSAWENPFMAGEPLSVRWFSDSSEHVSE